MDGEKIGFDQLQKMLEQPVKLSEKEQEKITEIFLELNVILSDLKNEILQMDREEAFRYMEIILQKFSAAKADFENGIKPETKKHHPRPEPKTVEPTHPKGYFLEMYNQLTTHQKDIAERTLDCVKTAFQLIESEEGAPEEALCPDCNLEAMINCINTEDPSIRDEMDEDLARQRAAHRQD